MSNSSFYAATPNRLINTSGSLSGDHKCDVCIIGANITGVSAALELAEKEFSVILLDKKNSSALSPGLYSGQLLRGYSASNIGLINNFGKKEGKILYDMSLEGLAYILENISKYKIQCDLKFGNIRVATNNRQLFALNKEAKLLSKLGYNDLEFVKEKKLKQWVKSKNYKAGFFDPKEARFHPLNYTLAIAQVAHALGCRIYDDTSVISFKNTSQSTKIITEEGSVTAKFVILAGRIKLKETKSINNKSMSSIEHIIATEPLSTGLIYDILPRKEISVTERSNNKNYFYLTSDNRLIFGGNQSFTGAIPPMQTESLKEKMAEIFAPANRLKINYKWNRSFDTTINHMPVIGRLKPNIFYASGFGYKDIILKNLAGKIISMAINGTAKKFDIFSKIKHTALTENKSLKKYYFAIAKQWMKLKDVI